MNLPSNQNHLHVFVHLARGFGRSAWKRQWDEGRIVGINHDDPYGYRQAEEMGCTLEQSEDYAEGYLTRLLRLSVRAILGFDLLHAWRNRKGIFAAQIVWTHTESQALAVLLLMRLHAPDQRSVAVIAQTVWVMDNWESYSLLRRAFYRSLLQRADVLTFLSPSAAVMAMQRFPGSRVEFVKYGIRADQPLALVNRAVHTPIRVLTMGNDRHRDWPTFIAAIKNDPRYVAKAATGAKIKRLLANVHNINREKANTNDQLMELLRWADVAVICLLENLHASGITVIEEAVLCGIPVITTDVGGLRGYFGPEEVTYVPANDPEALRSAIDRLMANEQMRRQKARNALMRMKNGDLNSRSFVARHVELSNDLLRSRRAAYPSEAFSSAARP